MSFQIVPGLASFADKYDGYILDLWGVVHDGTKPYPGVLDCMAKLREGGKPLLLLSNAPRVNKYVQEFLLGLGIPEDAYDHILTSGDITRLVLEQKRFPYLEGDDLKFYQFGAKKDRGLDDNLGYIKTNNLEEADFLICTGLANDLVETPEDYRELLTTAAARQLPMLCANPDLTVMRGDTTLYCAGSLAKMYEEELGGQVELFGKPYEWSYKMSMEKLGISDPSKLLAVGDSMRTDIRGATGMGIDNVLVSGGIHAEEWELNPGDHPSQEQMQDLTNEFGFAPTYVVGHMVW